MSTTQERVQEVLRQIPAHITVLAAAKGVSPATLLEALEAGIHVVGENRIPEARVAREAVGAAAQWHFIGRLRPHDVRPANVALFDVIETVDSIEVAARLNAVCARAGRQLPVYIEVNSAREPQKGGVEPERAPELVRDVALLRNLRVEGLMTMGPLCPTQDEYRPFFSATRRLFEHIGSLSIPGVDMRHLSMGTSDSYVVAIEEGATIVRLGTTLFGGR
jgi:PLP dependent protein